MIRGVEQEGEEQNEITIPAKKRGDSLNTLFWYLILRHVYHRGLRCLNIIFVQIIK